MKRDKIRESLVEFDALVEEHMALGEYFTKERSEKMAFRCMTRKIERSGDGRNYSYVEHGSDGIDCIIHCASKNDRSRLAVNYNPTGKSDYEGKCTYCYLGHAHTMNLHRANLKR